LNRLVEVKPIYRDGKYREEIKYRRIRVEDLDVEMLKAFFRMKKSKDSNITDILSHFVYQYRDKPTIFLDKKDGRLYSFQDEYLARRQAIFILKILSRFGKVEGYDRKQRHSNALRFVDLDGREVEQPTLTLNVMPLSWTEVNCELWDRQMGWAMEELLQENYPEVSKLSIDEKVEFLCKRFNRGEKHDSLTREEIKRMLLKAMNTRSKTNSLGGENIG